MDYHRIEADMNDEEFLLFQDFILQNSGIFVDEIKRDMLRKALLARTTFLNLSGYADYYKFLKYNPRGEEEFKEILNLITICETYFFRDIKHFHTLRHYLLPEIIKRKQAQGSNGIRIWSAGCSTGEEPYSIAITLLEALQPALMWDVEIFASDVSTKALKTAQEGVYSKWSLRSTDRSYIEKYFIQDDKKYALKDEIKKAVNFEYFNLIREPFPLSKMGDYWDIIFCRNVTIYFKHESTKRVISNFYNSLQKEGYLFIGASESLYHISNEFELLEIENNFMYQKPDNKMVQESKRGKITIEKITATRPSRKIRNEDALLKKDIKAIKAQAKQPAVDEKIGELYKNAQYYFEADMFEKALFELMKIIECTDEHPETYLMLADIYANKEQFDEAERECRKALELDSLLSPAHFLLGIILNKKGKTEEAIKEFNKTVYLDPDFPLAHFNLANIYSQNKEYQKSMVEYKVTIEVLNKGKDALPKIGGGFSREILIQTCQRNMERIKKIM
ncbi:MAG: CheR family methyltransferase [bacterium]|nr:CheR family methyltransferase [bacterium]